MESERKIGEVIAVRLGRTDETPARPTGRPRPPARRCIDTAEARIEVNAVTHQQLPRHEPNDRTRFETTFGVLSSVEPPSGGRRLRTKDHEQCQARAAG